VLNALTVCVQTSPHPVLKTWNKATLGSDANRFSPTVWINVQNGDLLEPFKDCIINEYHHMECEKSNVEE